LNSCWVFNPAPYRAPTMVTAAKAPVQMTRFIVFPDFGMVAVAGTGLERGAEPRGGRCTGGRDDDPDAIVYNRVVVAGGRASTPVFLPAGLALSSLVGGPPLC
jgi:hypothetical protein